MSILESIRRYFLACPFLRDGPLGVDYLGSHVRSYTIDSVPCTKAVKQYTDGSSVRQFLFVFAGREPYGGGHEESLYSTEFYERLSEWIESQNRIRNLPDMEDGKEAVSLEVLSAGYVLDTGSKAARYQIQCRLKYFQEVL